MAARVTQQVLTGSYTTDAEGRVTALAIEVIRTTASAGLGGGAAGTVVVVCTS